MVDLEYIHRLWLMAFLSQDCSYSFFACEIFIHVLNEIEVEHTAMYVGLHFTVVVLQLDAMYINYFLMPHFIL